MALSRSTRSRSSASSASHVSPLPSLTSFASASSSAGSSPSGEANLCCSSSFAASYLSSSKTGRRIANLSPRALPGSSCSVGHTSTLNETCSGCPGVNCETSFAGSPRSSACPIMRSCACCSWSALGTVSSRRDATDSAASPDWASNASCVPLPLTSTINRKALWGSGSVETVSSLAAGRAAMGWRAIRWTPLPSRSAGTRCVSRILSRLSERLACSPSAGGTSSGHSVRNVV